MSIIIRQPTHDLSHGTVAGDNRRCAEVCGKGSFHEGSRLELGAREGYHTCGKSVGMKDWMLDRNPEQSNKHQTNRLLESLVV